MSVDDDFIDRILEGEASDEEAAEFQTWLRVPENLKRYALLAELHADLRRSLQRRQIQKRALEVSADGSASDLALSSPERPSRVIRTRQILALAVTGLVTAVCFLIAFVGPEGNRDPDSADVPAAFVVRNVNGLLTKNGSQWDDLQLPVGDYELQNGLLHLQFGDEVMVYVEAPARFNAVSDKRVVLHRGRLSASVPPEGVGFTVETPEAEVVDFGTEFSVDVEGGASEVHVFDGLVRVKPRSRKNGEAADAVDLRTSQAVKIEGAADKPVEIQLATDRFIRTFDESRRRYTRTVRRFEPLAFYRMAIRDQGLACLPEEYSGVVLTGVGNRPPHARGVFAGGSLRVLADSVGRGGRVETAPPLRTGRFTLAAFVYLEAKTPHGIVATNIRKDGGNFSLALDEMGCLQATIRNVDGDLQSITSQRPVELQTWRHVVMTVDGGELRLYEDGHPVAIAPCAAMANGEGDALWFGTDSDGMNLWDGRIDEVALFDRAISDAEVTDLYQAALEEIGKSE